MVNLRGEDWLMAERSLDWYTGKAPLPGVCPGVTSRGIHSLPQPNFNKVTRQDIQDYFDNSWTIVEALFAGFKGEEPFYRPPVHGLRHPQIFYYGHTPCLYINKLRVAGVLDSPVNAYFESIFEVGVDEMLWDDMHKNDMIWPKVEEVYEYRKEVYKVISNMIATSPLLDDPSKIGWDHPMWALFMSFEHEKIHVETSSVLFRETPINLMQIPKGWPEMHPSVKNPTVTRTNPQAAVDYPQNEMISVSGGRVELGKPRDFPSFGMDNEYGSRTLEVPAFSASKYMITNGEFWHFVASGGYRTEKYWSPDAWGWRKHRNMKWPFFWQQDGPQGSMQFKLRNVFEITDMQWDWPVNVNYHEARAYCKWRDEVEGLDGKPEAYRVITEAEHHLIRDESLQMSAARADPDKDKALSFGGDKFADASAGAGAANLNLAYGSHSPVDALPPSSSGHCDAMGNAWEWTEDHFNPMDGFKVHPVYDDFSAPCFDGKHHIIMGGSFASMGDNGASVFCRYHFRAHFLQHSGFRLVQSSDPAPATLLASEEYVPQAEAADETNVYETTQLVDQYLGLHFPASGVAEGVAPILGHASSPEHALAFPQRVSRLLTSLEPKRTTGRVLDLGCAVGGGSFELASSGMFDEVVGIDFSKAFIDAAEGMRQGQKMRFILPVEGSIEQEVTAAMEPNVDAAALARVSFQVGDACKLVENSAALGKFDGVVLANLLCRLPEPVACLDGLSAIINPGGVAVIVTPFSWLEQYTHKSKWLGGFPDPVSGEPIHSKEVLRAEMEKRGFVKIHEEQMPLVIREHQRKYQYIVSEATAWRRL